MLTVEPKILVSILQKHQTTLRVVSFHKLALLQIDYAKGRDKVNLWARFFEQLAKLKLGLSAMNMSMLTQQGTGM